jgi:predicted permease
MRLVGLASSLVPARRREEWREAWLGEVLHGDRNGFDLVRRSAGAFSHAIYLAAREIRMEHVVRDFLYGFRSLKKRPGFSSVVVLTIALGIGANTFLFSVVQGLLLHPFPYRDIDRLVAFSTVFPKLASEELVVESMALADYRFLEERSTHLTSFLAFDLGNRDLSGIGEPQRLLTAAFWGDAFETLGMTPALGRGFTREEMERMEPVAIVSHRVFQEHLGGDPARVGRSILVNGTPRTLVGVMPERLLLMDTDLWLPMWYPNPQAVPRSRRLLTVLARLKDGSSLEEARAELDVLAQRISEEAAREAPEYEGFRLTTAPFLEVWAGFVGPAAWILLGASGLALLIACANIAGLLLARGASRRHEMAVRTAIGAGRMRLVLQLLAEALVLSVAGAALAVVLAHFALVASVKRLPASLPLSGIELGIDGPVLGFTAVVSLLAAFVFGIAPALQTAKVSVVDALSAEGGRTTGAGRALRLRRTFVALQIGACLVLLTGAVLLGRSFSRLMAVESGMSLGNVLTMRITLAWERYQGKVVDFHRRWLLELEPIPGVREAALASQLPPFVFIEERFRVEGRDSVPGEVLSTFVTKVSPAYFDALEIPLLRGRGITEADTDEAPLVVVVNETFARRFFPGEDPLDRRIDIDLDGEEPLWATIVGVVSDVRNRGLERPAGPEAFGSYQQRGEWSNQMHLVLKTERDAMAALPAVRATLRRIDPDQPIYAIETLRERYESTVFHRRSASVAMSGLAVLAVALATMGLYGVISFMVGDRRREIGIRIALGAGTKELTRFVFVEYLKLVFAGIALGLVAAVALARTLSGFLYEVEPHDPGTLATTVLLLLLSTVAATLVPARRAARVDPVESFR